MRKAKSWEELEDFTSGGKWKDMDHWRFQRLDLAMSPPLMRVMKSHANFYLTSKLGLQNREKARSADMLGGRQILWMLIDAFKTNSNMMTSYTWKDIDSVQWLGDAKPEVVWT